MVGADRRAWGPAIGEQRRVARFTAAAVAIPPTPRLLVGAMDVALRGVLSLISFGLVPAMDYAVARARRRRVSRFLRDGDPAMAEVLSVVDETSSVDTRIVRVTDDFEAHGERRRDTDRLLPAIARRWQPGDRVQVLYLADEGCDSVVIGAGWSASWRAASWATS